MLRYHYSPIGIKVATQEYKKKVQEVKWTNQIIYTMVMKIWIANTVVEFVHPAKNFNEKLYIGAKLKSRIKLDFVSITSQYSDKLYVLPLEM